MNRIKQLRVEKNLLQSDVAKYIDKSERIVGFYEKGERDPNTETLIKLSELFDVSIDYILGKTDIRNYDKDEQEFRYAYHKEIEGMSEEEVLDALRFYKEMKKKIEDNKK